MFQLQLDFITTHGYIVLPAALLGYERYNGGNSAENVGLGACAFCKVSQLQLQIRLNDYYMGMASQLENVNIFSYTFILLQS